MRIEQLNDYAAMKKLAAALWQEDSAYHGAGVMVGSGFSRSAASTGNPEERMPIWRDLSKVLSKDLGIEHMVDPLRLAEEYSAYFGRQSLLDTLKKELNDVAWMPGDLHGKLLELPWSEVLTTNWDTLLERASTDVAQRVYSVVSRQEDLSSMHSPRIVKLHGTVNVTDDLVFTQEDFRKYPQQHAAFVNFARHVFIENELCLLGFSGDDPNFLQWVGWVRDHLGSHARRIYLVGDLGLTAAKRKYFESINIAPIDLAALVDDFDNLDARHQEATKAFLSALKNLKPKHAWEWVPVQLHRTTMSNDDIDRTYRDKSYAAGLLEQQLPALVKDRVSYPEWLVCPERQRWQLQTQVNDPYPTRNNLLELSEESRAILLYELAWRHEVTFEAMPQWLAELMINVCDPDKPSFLAKQQQMRMALLLLRNSRWVNGADAESIKRTAVHILERNTKHWPESANELAYCRAISARDSFDYISMEEIVENISTADPVWKLRKASMLSEIGRFEEGGSLVANAYRELLGRYRKNRGSIYCISRLAWAHWMLRATEILKLDKEIIELPSYYQDSKCSPWHHIECIRDRVSSALEKQQKSKSIEPLFEPGSYQDNSKSITFSGQLHPLLLLEGVCDLSGMPIRWSNVNLLAEEASRLAMLEDIDGAHRFSLAIRAASSDTSDVLKRVFSRSEVAKLTRKDAEWLLINCRNAVEYWSRKLANGARSDTANAMERLRVFMEVLARVSVRATSSQAKDIFRLALELGKRMEFRHFWLFGPLDHLIKYTLKSVPAHEQFELLSDALSFPLEQEIGVESHDRWPNPIIENPGARGANTALDRRIDEIIDLVAPCSKKSLPALLRLLPMVRSGFLREAETKKLSEKIWGIAPEYKKLPQTGLLTYLLLVLPTKNIDLANTAVRKYLFEDYDGKLLSSDFLNDVVCAAEAKKHHVLPSTDRALELFDKLVVWRPKESSREPFEISGQHEQGLARWAGLAIAESAVPAMAADALSEERFNKMLSFHSEVSAPEIITAFACFAAVDDSFAERTEKLIRRVMQSRKSDDVAYGSYSILKWRELERSPSTDRLVQRLIHLVGSGRAVALPALLWTANELFVKKLLSEEDAKVLAEIVPVIFDAASYHNIAPSSTESVTASLIRTACHKLSRDILDASVEKDAELLRVVAEASEDALPEVRFA
ncbi:MAG: SIR2 family protein [Lysobacteraceae bacterium]